MNKIFFLFSLLVLLLAQTLGTSVWALQLKCDPNKIYQYSYQQVSNVFGGAYFHVEGTLELYCGERVKSEKLGTALSIVSLHLVDTVHYLSPPKCVSDKSVTEDSSNNLFEKEVFCKPSNLNKLKEMEKPRAYRGLEKPFGFVQDSDGRVIRMFSHKDETAQIRDLKKAIVSQFQTKLKGTADSIVEDFDGVHNTHYSKIVDKQGVTHIKAEHDEFDAQDNESKQNAKGTEQHAENIISLSHSGEIQKVEAELSFELTEKPDQGNVEYEEPHINNKNGDKLTDYLSVSGYIAVHLVGQKAPKSKHRELHDILVLTKQIIEGTTKKTTSHHYTIDNLEVLDNDLLKKKGLHQHSTQVDHSEYSVLDNVKRKVMEEHGGFSKLLGKFLKEPSLLSLAIQYTEYFPEESLPIIWKKFGELKGKPKKQSKLQGLMAESQTPTGVKMLLETIESKPLNYKLIQTGLFYTTSIEKPSVAVAEFVKKYIKFSDKSIPVRERNVIKTNALLYLANVASKLSPENAKPYLEVINNGLLKSRHDKDTELHIIALHNMGEKKPKEAAKTLEFVLNNEEVSESVKIAAIKALRSHVNQKDGEHHSLKYADKIIHKVVNSDDFSDEAKVAAILTQTHRQKINKNDQSVKQFIKLMKNEDTSPEVYDSILDYLAHVEDKENVLSLLKSDEEFDTIDNSSNYEDSDEESDVLFIRRAVRRLRRASNSAVNFVGDTARRAAKEAQRVAEEAARRAEEEARRVAEEARRLAEQLDVKRQAERIYRDVKKLFFPQDDGSFNERCFDTTTRGNPICVRDAYFKSMFGRVSNDLQKMKNSRHFVWEKRAGNSAVHAYVGFAAISASRFPGCKDVSEDNAALWATMVGFSAHVKLIFFSIPVFEVELKFNRLKDQGNLDDEIYILVGPVIIRTNIIPGSSIAYDEGALSVRDMLNCVPHQLDFASLNVEKKLAEKEKIVKAGVVPMKFSFVVSATYGLGIGVDVCIATYKIMAGPSPYLKLSVEVAGGLTGGIFDAMLAFKPEAAIRAPVFIGTNKCSFAADVGLDFSPFTFYIYFVIRSKGIPWQMSFPIYTYEMGPIQKTLLKFPTPQTPIPLSETGSPRIPPKAYQPFNPLTSLQKPALPRDRNRFHFKWYTSTGAIVKPLPAGKPPKSRVLQQSPPIIWKKVGDTGRIAIETVGLKCNFVEMMGFYIYGYVFVPHGVRTIIDVSTDDVSWISVNGKQVVHDGCCGTRTHDITSHVRGGEWNLFDATGAEYCYYGILGIRFHKFDPKTSLTIPEPPYDTSRYHYEWYTASGSVVTPPGRRNPTRNEVTQRSPPNEWRYAGNGKEVEVRIGNIRCGWKDMVGLYVHGYVFIPFGDKTIIDVTTDDESWISVNGKQVIHDGCCGTRTHDITRHVKKGEWNLIEGILGEYCHSGIIKIKFRE